MLGVTGYKEDALDHGDLPFLGDAVINCAALYWVAKSSSRQMPDRQDIDPLEIPTHVLPHISLIEPCGPRNRFRYRLCGTEVAGRFESDPTGKTSDVLFEGKYREYLESLIGKVRDTLACIYSESRFSFEDGSCESGMLLTHRLLMPLQYKGDDAGIIFLVQTWPRGGSAFSQHYERVIRTADMEHHLARLVNMRPEYACAAAS